MSSTKAALKAAKAALDAQKYDEAVVQAQLVLASDSQNYFAKIFLGRALDKQGKPDEAAKAYESATRIKPNDDQAWLGLRSLYETQGSSKVDEYISVAVRLAEIYAEQDDRHRCQTTVNKLVDFTRANGTKAQYKRALEVQLPTSSVYSCLEGRVPHPSHTYTRLAEITEDEEKERINKEIGERRTRLGARLGQVTTEVKREVYNNSSLEGLYQNIIEWTNDDEVRRQYEEKLLQRAYDTLIVLQPEWKAAKREQVVELARGMVIIKHPFELAWELELEWTDVENLQELDLNVLWEFTGLFPDKGLSKVLTGYMNSDVSPFALRPHGAVQNGEDNEKDAPPSAEECLLLMTEGFEDSKQSVLAHRLMGEYYLHLEEYESTVETTRNGLKVLAAESQKSGLKFQNNLDALNSTLATSLVHYQSPRNHPEAKALLEAILGRKPTFTPALIGIGLIYEEEEEYPQAIDFLSRALQHDPDNARIGAEAAWCKALAGDYAQGLEELESYLPGIKTTDARSRDLRAQTLYRIGMCLWQLHPDKAARKDREGAYSRFLAAIRTNVNFAPAYTSLGFYYADYAKDKKRARQCFQKAFELSASEVEAAERLARFFADQAEWDIVEIIAQRVVDSGRVRPAPGSKKRGISWPFSALGVVQINKQEYQKSVVSFLSALRISPDDYHSYVGLGESYHNSGRYNSAARTFRYAENPDDGVQMKGTGERWFTRYMLANVNRELGQYDQATEGYQEVLKDRPKEFGVSIALLQTFIERGRRCIETGFFGQAVESAKRAIGVAQDVASYRPDAFNLWKAVGDACSIYSWVQGRLDDLPFGEIKDLLEMDIDVQQYSTFADVDGIGPDALTLLSPQPSESASLSPSDLSRCMDAAILAQKRAILSCAHDVHAQAVAWYNLGWIEHRAHVCLEQITGQKDVPPTKRATKFLKASMRCFKRAIELEAGNADFWNALGVATTQLNPKVAQHSFVRSLHLNERTAHVWTNLGTLYLLQSDYELAHTAFARAQSTDPDYAHAWLGEGLIALLWGDLKEALLHFTHAFEISDSSSLITKRQYAVSTFDHLVSSSSAASNVTNLIQPLFALQQLQSQNPSDITSRHLAALYLERVGSHDTAIDALTSACAAAEADYETSESAQTLFRFAQAKADLARNRLATYDYATAAEDAETALDLSSEEGTQLDAEARRKTRLAARLTAGLSHYYLGDMDQAIDAFRQALEESNSSPDVVCLLAEVLWAKGGEEEKTVAREQLFECVERQPGHVGAVVLLGAMAALDEDRDAMDAVEEDLQAMRTNTDLDTRELRRVEKVLHAIAALSSDSADGDVAGVGAEVMAEITTAIVLAPGKPHGWTQLAAVTDEPFPALMALKTAARAVPPNGPLSAAELARAFAGTGIVGDAQRAVMLAPGLSEGWDAFVSVVNGV